MSQVDDTSTFIGHEPCPSCRAKGQDYSGNNLARYSDGHGYCHACGFYEHADGQGGETTSHTEERNAIAFDPIPVNLVPLKKRGLTLQAIEKYGYGVGRNKHNQVCHVAPYYDAKGTLVAQHIRLEGKEFRWIGDMKSAVLFGQHLYRRGGRRVVVTEGEIDCLTVSQLQDCKWPVVSLPNGVSHAVKAFKTSLEWLESFEQVVIAFDMDDVGQKAAQECAALLSHGKAQLAVLPCKDANECLMQGKTAELINSLWQASPWRPDGIRSGKDLWDDLIKSPPIGYTIPYQELNDMLHGIRLGELYMFTAGSGIGKSTIVNEIAYHLRMTHGLSLGIMALEESPSRNLRRYVGIHMNLPLHLPEVHHAVDKEMLREAFDAITGDDKWCCYDHFGSTGIDSLLSKLRYMVVSLGVQVIVLDHISIVVSGLDEGNGGESERKVIDKLVTRLRQLIEETGITVLAVVHLKRPDKGKSYNEGRQVTLTDLRGSGSLEQLSDVVIALERDQQGEDPNRAYVRVLKNRPIGITGVAGCVEYDAQTGRLLPSSDADSYGFTPQDDENKQEDF